VEPSLKMEHEVQPVSHDRVGSNPPHYMPQAIIGGQMTVDLSSKPAQASGRLDDETFFRLVILGDFSGRSHRQGNSLPPALPVRIDCENFERVFAKFDVVLNFSAAKAGSDALALKFCRLEDFHPDELIRRVESLSRLANLRTRLQNPATADAAVAESREVLKMPSTGIDRPPSSSTETNEELLTRLLEKPAGQPSRAVPPASTVEKLIKQLVAPSVVPGQSPQQTETAQLVESELSGRLAKLLHDPDFQALEAAWRGIDFLIRGVDDQTQCYLIDITKDELAALAIAGDLAKTAVFKQLNEIGPGVVLGMYTFGLPDLALLKTLGSLAEAHQTAFVTGASPEMVGCRSFGLQPDPDDWLHGEGVDAFAPLRRLPEAAHLGLLMPRFLLRQPYGAGSDPIEAFPFEEMLSAPEHEFYLWGNPAVLCGYLLADAFAAEGRPIDTGGGGVISGLPVHTYAIDGETHAKPCAEAWLSEKAAEVILEHGIMPVASIRGRDAVELKALRAFSLSPKPLPVRYG
jgi:type VI secretion system protein ImpC